MAIGFFVLLACGLLLLWLAQRRRVRSGLPRGRVVYSDTGGWGRVDRPLFSHEFQLTGKPDYLVRIFVMYLDHPHDKKIKVRRFSHRQVALLIHGWSSSW